MEKDKPKISVVIPTCNRPERLRNAIKSVLGQTYKDFEIIIVDDGMKERADKVIREFNDNRICYIKHEVNKGGGAARNTGIRNAKAELISFLDDDDEYYPEKLEKEYEIIKKYWDVAGFVFCDIEQYNEKTKSISSDPKRLVEFEGINNIYESLLAHNLRTYTPTLLIKKEVLRKVGFFDEKLPSSQEWDLMLKVAKKYKGYCLNKVLVRVNTPAGEHIGGNLERRIAGRELIIKNHAEELKKRPRILSVHYFQLGIFCRDNADFRKARKYLFKAWIYNKINFRIIIHILIVSGGKRIYKILRRIKDIFFARNELIHSTEI